MHLVRKSVVLIPASLAILAVACGQGSATLSPTGPTASNILSEGTGGSETAATRARDDKGDKGRSGNGGSDEKPGHGKPDVGDNDKIDKPFHGSLSGFVTAVSGTTITVRGITVTAAPDAIVRHGNRILDFTSIVVGNHVQAKGTMTEGALLASEIKVEQTNGEDGDDDDDPLRGAISGLSATTGCPVLTFVIGTTTITTSAATDFDDVACGALANGTVVEITGVVQTDGSILASKVEPDGEI